MSVSPDNGGSNFGAPKVYFNISIIAEWNLNLICRCVGQFTLTVAQSSLMRHSQLKLGGNNKLGACRWRVSAGKGGQQSQVPIWGREREAIITTSRSLASRILVVRRVWSARSTLVLCWPFSDWVQWRTTLSPPPTFHSGYWCTGWVSPTFVFLVIRRGFPIFEEGYRGLAGTTVAFGKFSTRTCLID